MSEATGGKDSAGTDVGVLVSSDNVMEFRRSRKARAIAAYQRSQRSRYVEQDSAYREERWLRKHGRAVCRLWGNSSKGNPS